MPSTSKTQDWRNSLHSAINNQIKLGVEAIFSGVFSGPHPGTLSFHHLLNRVMMVAQVPITFIVFKKEADGFRVVYRANNHKRHEDKISARYAAHPQYEEHLIPLWSDESPYSILVLKADKYDFPILERRPDISEDCNIWDVAAYKIESVLDGKRYQSYGRKFVGYLFDSIERMESVKSSRHIDRCRVHSPMKEDFDRSMRRHASRWKVIGRGIIDRIYGKLEKNILSIANPNDTNGKLTNFIMFARDYDVDLNAPLRYGCYNYSLRILIGSRQSEEIGAHLREWLKGGERSARERRYIKQVDAISDQGSAAGLLAKDVSSWFWNLLEAGDAGVEKIIENLAGYFGQNARSIADPVFEGVSFFRAPFAKDAGMGRCFVEDKGETIPSALADISDPVVKNDLLRIVTCQYIFESMATHSEDNESNLQIMLNPVEVGGRVWGVVGYVTRSRRPDVVFSETDDPAESVRIFDDYWLQNYHIYQDVNERMKKNLRTYMNRFYEGAVADAYNKWLKENLDGVEEALSVSESIDEQRERLQDDLNERLSKLSCLFPYDVVQGEIVQFPKDRWPWPDSDGMVLRDGLDRPAARTALISRGWGLRVRAVAASCFPDAPGGRSEGFVDEVDVAVAMTDEVLRTAFELYVAMNAPELNWDNRGRT